MKTSVISKWVLGAWILLFNIFPAFTQTTIKGKVTDSETNEPIPYASVFINGTNTGTISNAEGCFRFIVNEDDSGEIVFQCLGYHHLSFNIDNGIPQTVRMDKASIIPEHKGSAVYSSAPLEIFYDAVRNARKNKTKRSARSFLSVETINSDDIPFEVLEAYYQSDYTIKKGLSAMKIKNGRFGKLDPEVSFFSSLHSAKALTNYELFLHARKAYFINSPFSLSKSKGDDRYTFILDGFLEDRDQRIAIIHFSPREGYEELLSGTAYVEMGEKQFRQICMHISDTRQFPAPVADETRLKAVSLDMVLNFRNDINGQIMYDYIKFDYDYGVPGKDQSMLSEAILVFYDYDHPFLMPLCKDDALADDYEKIMATPFHNYFWDQNRVFEQTSAMKDHTEYFMDHGFAINYESDCSDRRPLASPIKVWDPNSPITWDDFLIRDISDMDIDTPFITLSDQGLGPEDPIKLDFHIFLDCNMDGDSLYFCCRTVFNRRTSYYFEKHDSLALEYINLQFDMVESVRRKMAEALCNKRYKIENAGDIDLIYQDYMQRMQRMLATLRNDVRLGQDQAKLTEWKNKVQAELNRATASLSH